jgi:hypothetical protein
MSLAIRAVEPSPSKREAALLLEGKKSPQRHAVDSRKQMDMKRFFTSVYVSGISNDGNADSGPTNNFFLVIRSEK